MLKKNRFNYIHFIVLICMSYASSIIGQANYDIRFDEVTTANSQQVCYNVSLRGSNASWYLAGQNYRLYYDAEVLSFQSGQSLLNKSYQDFTLVQDLQNVNAKKIEGCLHYAENLGFLNYSIDLLNTSEASALLSTGETWLPTTQLCFELTGVNTKAPTLTWGREVLTQAYAFSFTEVSEWINPQTSKSAKAKEHIDINFPCEAVEIVERDEETTREDFATSDIRVVEEDTATYDIRIVEKTNSIIGQSCYTVSIKSAKTYNWHVAGQNYRLYFDASQLSFLSGTSLLGDNYQPFNLVEDLENIDASKANGCLHFSKNLGFLNYSIDQLNTDREGVLIAKNTWLPTTEICFEKQEENRATLIWGREELTNVYATSYVEISEWTGSNKTQEAKANNYLDIGEPCKPQETVEEVSLVAKAFLQGAYDIEKELMHDKLREKSLIPLIEPYSDFITTDSIKLFKIFSEGNERIEDSVLQQIGEQAVVDWIFLELRDQEEPTRVVATRSALILRNGFIVDLDGKSPVKFMIKEGKYFLTIQHRNHLGIMTANALSFDSNSPTLIDLTDPNTPVLGQDSQKNVNDLMCLWGGNVNMDDYVIFQGGGLGLSDADQIFFDIYLDELNSTQNYNHISRGYFNSDTNMDGEIKYQGPNNDRDELLFFNVVNHPDNPKYHINFYIEGHFPR